ncbi:unnamed protein product [Lactuca virosa]|uniref:Uncharacterized protein n=1 Tax=Lactuca virosa TaxID=75947 RepID=A0AAU9LJ66_9ASTR|nr:unnamed protein product [Lactuca virosa]
MSLSSDSPRRITWMTWLSVGSQLTPYQLVQQSVPVQVLNMPKYGSVRADLKANNADRSAGGQQLTTAANSAVVTTRCITFIVVQEQK